MIKRKALLVKKDRRKAPFTIPSAGGKPSADTAVRRWRRLYAQSERAQWPPPGGGGKRGQGHRMVPLPPLDSPKPSFALTHRRCAAKRELRRLGSVRQAALGTLSGPEVSLRDLPRITVRGQTVQGGRFPLRTAPLRSMVYPWSTRRPCGPLVFRRATEGSRGAKEGLGCQEGQGNHLVSLPLLLSPVRTGVSAAGRRQFSPTVSAASS